jgi:hypothetical protein
VCECQLSAQEAPPQWTPWWQCFAANHQTNTLQQQVNFLVKSIISMLVDYFSSLACL